MNASLTLIPVMNNTKWNELRLAMLKFDPTPAWRTRCWANGYVSQWDKEWFYHFNVGGYELIEWVEICIELQEQQRKVLSELAKIHVPIEEISNGFRVYGYIKKGQYIEYAKL